MQNYFGHKACKIIGGAAAPPAPPVATAMNIVYNFTLFQVYHVISAKCYTLYSKKSMFDTFEIAVIKYRVVLKGNYMSLH